MEELKDYARKLFDFSNQHDLEARFFERALSETLDNALIYYSDCQEFYNLNTREVIELSQENGWQVDPTEDSLHQITDTSREALCCLVYNHLYSELEEAYKEAQRLSKEEFLENEFKDNLDMLIDNNADYILSREDLKEMTKNEIEEDNLFMVKHLAEALEEYAEFYQYDRGMGTLESPTPLKDNEDLLDIAEELDLIKKGE